MPSEFQLINQYFKQRGSHQGVMLGIGDDAALLNVPQGEVLVATTDTFISGRHFPKDTHPFAIGHKALAVNLSDLAAMGATPRWVLLAITLPNPNEFFIQEFANGLFNLANQHHVALVGGDTTKGSELSITITALGTVPIGQAIKRDGAQIGDGIYVSNTVGDAGLGLKVALQQLQNIHLSKEQLAFYKARLDFPQPRIALGLTLRGLASACLDVSDGLAQDLGHILQASHVGATLQLEHLPLSDALRVLPFEQACSLALCSGDDYELCFTMSDAHFLKLKDLSVPITRIGTITAQMGLLLTYQGQPYSLSTQGFQHF
jgi:thiamine-monophosphate kinase